MSLLLTYSLTLLFIHFIHSLRAFFSLSSSTMVIDMDLHHLPSFASSASSSSSADDDDSTAVVPSVGEDADGTTALTPATLALPGRVSHFVAAGLTFGFVLTPAEDGNWVEQAIHSVSPRVGSLEFEGKVVKQSGGGVEWAVRAELTDGIIDVLGDHVSFQDSLIALGSHAPHLVLMSSVAITPRLDDPDNVLMFDAKAVITNSSMMEFAAEATNEWHFALGSSELVVNKLELSLIIHRSTNKDNSEGNENENENAVATQQPPSSWKIAGELVGSDGQGGGLEIPIVGKGMVRFRSAQLEIKWDSNTKVVGEYFCHFIFFLHFSFIFLDRCLYSW